VGCRRVFGTVVQHDVRPRPKRNSIQEQFVAHTRAMRESAAWRALPDNARRILDLLEVEHMRHGGAENGRLSLSYGQFELGGIRRKSIKRALDEGVALGFLEVTRTGFLASNGFKTPSTYRLTYLFGPKDVPGGVPTHEWRSLSGDKEAAQALAKIPFSQGRRRHWTSGESATQDNDLVEGGNALQVLGAKRPLTSISPGYGRQITDTEAVAVRASRPEYSAQNREPPAFEAWLKTAPPAEDVRVAWRRLIRSRAFRMFDDQERDRLADLADELLAHAP
jgi:hypothetical protein